MRLKFSRAISRSILLMSGNLRPARRLLHRGAHLTHVLGLGDEGNGQEIHVQLDGQFDVLAVLGGRHVHAQDGARRMDALAAAQPPARLHLAHDVGIVAHVEDAQFDQAVVQIQGVAGGDVARQVRVVERHDVLGAWHRP